MRMEALGMVGGHNVKIGLEEYCKILAQELPSFWEDSEPPHRFPQGFFNEIFRHSAETAPDG